jgi:hypothetical protein
MERFLTILLYIFSPYTYFNFLITLIAKKKWGSYYFRLKLGAIDRPHYGYLVYSASILAKKLGLNSVSIIEFGVAGGNGLVNLEYHAKEVSKITNINLYGSLL